MNHLLVDCWNHRRCASIMFAWGSTAMWRGWRNFPFRAMLTPSRQWANWYNTSRVVCSPFTVTNCCWRTASWTWKIWFSSSLTTPTSSGLNSASAFLRSKLNFNYIHYNSVYASEMIDNGRSYAKIRSVSMLKRVSSTTALTAANKSKMFDLPHYWRKLRKYGPTLVI